MQTPDESRSTDGRIWGLVEEYTPDTTIGRIVLATLTAPIGFYSLMLAFGFLVNPWVGSLLIVPAGAILGIALTITTVLTLWPVYLSAIGRIDSPEEYRSEVKDEADRTPIEQLKLRYQHGELTEEAFEREVETLLNQPTSQNFDGQNETDDRTENQPAIDRVSKLAEPER